MQKSVALLKVKSDVVLPKFLQYCYISNPRLYKVESASAQPNLLISKIKSTSVYIPPLELQQEFTLFSGQVDKLKFEMKKSLEEIKLNYQSLMKKCFE